MSWSDDGRLPRRLALRTGAALALGVGLAGCGFTLRQPPRLTMRSIALIGFAPHSPMAAALKAELAQQVQVMDSPAKAEVVLQALDDKRERSVVAQTAAAQVRELQLRLRLEFRVYGASGREWVPKTLLLLSRDLNFSENFALAKEQEEAELWREMQGDVVAQVLRRLTVVKG